MYCQYQELLFSEGKDNKLRNDTRRNVSCRRNDDRMMIIDHMGMKIFLPSRVSRDRWRNGWLSINHVDVHFLCITRCCSAISMGLILVQGKMLGSYFSWLYLHNPTSRFISMYVGISASELISLPQHPWITGEASRLQTEIEREREEFKINNVQLLL